MALYYLGLYYASAGDNVRAKESWNTVVNLGASQDRFTQSPLVQQAQAQLMQ